MKKKKLKKRIKKLEKELKIVIRNHEETFNTHRTMISNLGMSYIKLRTDLGMIKDACSKADANKKLNVLKQRTETDQTQFSKPSCDTCRYNGMGIDGPCLGCTKEGLEMYKSKEDSNE